MKAIILLAVLVLLPSLSAQKDITLSDEMPYPNIQLEKGSKIEATKLINESFVESFSEINFEISSRLYVHKGKLNETDVYNTSLYEPAAEAKCKIFPTDLKITSYSSMKVDSPDNDVVIIEKPQFEKSRNITAHVYLSAEKDENTFSIESYEVTADFSHLPATMPKSKQIKQSIISIMKHDKKRVPFSTKDSFKKLMNLNENLYIVQQSQISLFESETQTLNYVKGFSNTEPIFFAKEMRLKKEILNPVQFYILSRNKIQIYELVNALEVKLVRTIDDLPQNAILDVLYDSKYFYLVTTNSFTIIDLSQDKPVVSSMQTNGTCHHIEKFLTTLHLTCTFEKTRYIAEFLIVETNLKINRYYSELQMHQTSLVKKMGEGKMILIGDNEIRVQNYAINRNILQELGRSPPNFNYKFYEGKDVHYIDTISSSFLMTYLAVYSDRIDIVRIAQGPPELECSFANDKHGQVYTILAKFNTTRCSFVEDTGYIFYGNSESLCEVSIPIQITSKRSQMEAKKSHLITVAAIMFFLIILFIFCACAIICGRTLERQFMSARAALKKFKSKGQPSHPESI